MNIYAINISDQKGKPKKSVPNAVFIEGHGLSGDAHAGAGICQVSFLAIESIEKANRILVEEQKDLVLTPGIFAENITTQGIDLQSLCLGDSLCLGKDAVLEISQKGKKCHGHCSVYHRIGDCIMPRECVFAIVKKAGEVRTGDTIKLKKKENAYVEDVFIDSE